VKILALDSATSACSVALWSDGRVLAGEAAEMSRGHAEALPPMVDRVRRAAGVAFPEIDRFAVTVGPGHFTGLRIGLAAARGLALATGRPLIGVTTLEAVAAAVAEGERAGSTILVALDSKRAEPYVQSFDPLLRPEGPPAALMPSMVADRLVEGRSYVLVGDAADRLVPELRRRAIAMRLLADVRHPQAAIVAELAARAAAPAGFPAPVYLHPVETTSPKITAASR